MPIQMPLRYVRKLLFCVFIAIGTNNNNLGVI